MGIGTQGTSRNADTLANGIVGVNKLPRFFDPEVFEASMKLCLTNLLTCM